MTSIGAAPAGRDHGNPLGVAASALLVGGLGVGLFALHAKVGSPTPKMGAHTAGMIIGGGLASLATATARGDSGWDAPNMLAGLGGAIAGGILGPHIIGHGLGRGDISAAISNLAFVGVGTGALGVLAGQHIGRIPD